MDDFILGESTLLEEGRFAHGRNVLCGGESDPLLEVSPTSWMTEANLTVNWPRVC